LKIGFAKVKSALADVNYSKDGVNIKGTLERVDRDSVELKSTFSTKEVTLICNRCGKEYKKDFSYPLNLLLYNGKYSDNKNLDIIEFFDNMIDFDYIAQSEMTSLIEDYNLCDECQDVEDIFEKEF